MQLDLSEDIEEDSGDILNQRVKSKEELKEVKKGGNINFIYIRECFRYENTFGYLLSSGVVGSFNKTKKTNLVF